MEVKLKILEKNGDNYPKRLRFIKNAPQKLYIEGNENCLDMPSVTVVGSRNMTEYGEKMARKIVKELTDCGICIVSGMAIGIDSVAHRTCIENDGKTIAVLGSGLNNVYPVENKGLFKNIIESGGCVVSEQEPNAEAEKMFFPARNRIVSGLSLGTLVIEATYRSGTSITANLAFEQGKKVFCLPNMIGNKNSSGTINLIKKGAIMVTEGREILYELGIIREMENFEEYMEQQRINKINFVESVELNELDANAKNIYFYIKENKVVNSEVICHVLKMHIQDVNMYLTILELKGLIINKNGNNYTLREELYE